MKYDRAFKIATQFEADFNPIKVSKISFAEKLIIYKKLFF